MLGKKRKLKNESKSDNFLLKLYEILNNKGNSKIIHWSQDGSFIVINNIHTLSQKVLPIYFNHQNYSSFVRQLNMYNFHKIRTNQNNNEQYFIHEFFNKSKTLKEIKSFKRKTKIKGEKNNKSLFFQGEDSKIKHTIIDKKKEEQKKHYENIDLIEADEKKVKKYENFIKKGNLNYDLQKKMLLFLLNKSKENIDKQNEFKNKIKALKGQKKNCNLQIQNWNSKIENQSMFLKKIKNLYIFLVNLLIRNTNKERNENKMNTSNKDSKENKGDGDKNKLVDFIHRYINYYERNRIGFSSLDKSKTSYNKKNSIVKRYNSLSNIVQKSEAFSINQENLNLEDYLDKFELCSFKSFKSGKLDDSFSFFGKEKNLNNSFSMIGNNNIFNLNNSNGNLNISQNLFSEHNLTNNYNNCGNNINSSFFNT